MSKDKEFVFNDETVYNSYGFKVRTSGINIKRFKNNPVMLNDHWNSTRQVLGAWKDTRVDGAKLVGDPDFDTEDEDVKKIAGKVERGYIKGCSMGIIFDRTAMIVTPDGKYELTKCELLEVSIVAVPSNENSLQLYAADDMHLMDENEVKLSLQQINLSTKNSNENKMEKIILSVAALSALSLQATDDANAVSTAIEALSAKYLAEKKDREALQAKVDAVLKSNAEAMVDPAVTDGRLSADMRDEMIALAISSPATAAKLIAAMPAKTSLSGKVDNTTAAAAGEVKTPDDFQKLTATEQLAWKSANPDAYAKLFA